MGRKSVDRTRKPLSKKMELWLDNLIPAIAGKNLSDLTIDDIAALTKKSKSTIYEYFESKSDIIYTAVERRIAKLDDLPSTPENTSVLIAYNQLIEWLITHLKDVSFSFLNQLESHFSDPIAIGSWEIINEFMTELLNKLRSLYERGMEQGVFRPVSVAILMAMDEFFIKQWLSKNDKNDTIDKMIFNYVDVKLNGILN